MNLYLIAQGSNDDYDSYDSAVVAAPDEETARDMSPSTGDPVDWNTKDRWALSTWCSKRSDVTVTLIGVAKAGTKQGVICASLNAG